MAKKDKTPKQGIDWFKLAIIISRVCMALLLIYWGTVTFSEVGERTYNKYLHAVRKMFDPSSKPGDILVAGMSNDFVNKSLI